MSQTFLDNYIKLINENITVPSYSNFYNHLNNILIFPKLSTGIHLYLNRQTGPFTASSFSLSNHLNIIHFSLAHLYTSNNTLAYGNLHYPSRILDAFFNKKLYKNTFLQLRTYSSLSTNSHWTTILTHINPYRYNSQFIFTSTDNIIGHRLNYLLTKNRNLSIGYEIWCSLSNFAPSLSISFKHEQLHNNKDNRIFLLGINPLFGRILTSYYIKLNDNLHFATQYIFNAYSMKSQLDIGFNFNNNWGLRIGSNGIETIFNKNFNSWNFILSWKNNLIIWDQNKRQLGNFNISITRNESFIDKTDESLILTDLISNDITSTLPLTLSSPTEINISSNIQIKKKQLHQKDIIIKDFWDTNTEYINKK